MHPISLATFAATAAIAVNGARLLTSHLVTLASPTNAVAAAASESRPIPSYTRFNATRYSTAGGQATSGLTALPTSSSVRTASSAATTSTPNSPSAITRKPLKTPNPRKTESEKPTVSSSAASTNMATDAPTFATAKPAIPAIDAVAISPMPSPTNSKPVPSPPYATQAIGSPVAPIYGAKKGY